MAETMSRNTATNANSPRGRGDQQTKDSALSGDETIDYELIELFFFAYRDFVGDPDRILSDYGFGRAHHRVLHFVNRRPGLTIAELLEILGITKQSLNRVLKELIETGFVDSRTGEVDRRQRLLFPTQSGYKLAVNLARLQHERLARALSEAGPQAREHAANFLDGMSLRQGAPLDSLRQGAPLASLRQGAPLSSEPSK
jgi:DNA-binding MarR family transcriptional regulator